MWKSYQPSNLGICYCWNLFRYTSSLFQAARRLRDSRVTKIEKARTRKWEEAEERMGGTTTLPLFPSPALILIFRVPFTYTSFLLSERLEYAWINCALKMAYSACRQYSQKSLILLQILLGIPKHFRMFRPYIFRKYKKEPGPNP